MRFFVRLEVYLVEFREMRFRELFHRERLADLPGSPENERFSIGGVFPFFEIFIYVPFYHLGDFI
jgi:hypothetical protein